MRLLARSATSSRTHERTWRAAVALAALLTIAVLMSWTPVRALAADGEWIDHSLNENDPLADATFVDASHGWMVGTIDATSDGGIFTSADGGTSWGLQASFHYHVPYYGGTPLTKVRFVNAACGWVLGSVYSSAVPPTYAGFILRTTNGGDDWQRVDLPTTSTVTAMDFADQNTGWVVGAGGTILATTDGGASWQPQTSGVSATLRDVAFLDAKAGWAVGDDGTVLSTTDGGLTWQTHATGADTDFISVCPVDSANIWVGGAHQLIVSRDGGATWFDKTDATDDPRSWYFAYGPIAFVNATDGWLVVYLSGNDTGMIFTTRDGGETWHDQSYSFARLTGMDFWTERDGIAVGDHGSIYTTTNGGYLTPQIKTVSPSSGPVGTEVVLRGCDFTSATSVSFNGRPAKFKFDNYSIRAVVPRGATSGCITVDMPGGTGRSATFPVLKDQLAGAWRNAALDISMRIDGLDLDSYWYGTHKFFWTYKANGRPHTQAFRVRSMGTYWKQINKSVRVTITPRGRDKLSVRWVGGDSRYHTAMFVRTRGGKSGAADAREHAGAGLRRAQRLSPGALLLLHR